MIELIAGGARSGKSRYALNSAKSIGGNLHFVATAKAHDQAFSERIALHQAERGAEWALTEEPLTLSALASKFGRDDTVVVDCLTLWVTNWLCSENSDQWRSERDQFLSAISASDAHWILVSNETGMGVVPMGELSRQFVDESGWLHQACGRIADSVILVMFGIPQKLK